MKINPNNLRKHVLDMVYEKQSGHIGGSFSIAELTACLYSNYDLIKGKDKVILSKASLSSTFCTTAGLDTLSSNS